MNSLADKITADVEALADRARDAEAENATLRAQVAAVEALLGRDVHVVDVEATEFGLQHGFPCRPDLLGCAVNQALNDLDGPPAAPGRYLVSLDGDGGVVIGDRVSGDYDPLVTDLLRALFTPQDLP